MSELQFIRTYRLRIFNFAAGIDIAVGDVNDIIGSPLHINFEIEKSDVSVPNNAKIQIWNLAPVTIQLLEAPGTKVELKAGYADNMPVLLVGDVTCVTTTLDGTDMLTEIEVVDGYHELRSTYVGISVDTPKSSKELYEMVAKKMGVGIVFAPYLDFCTHSMGYVYLGRCSDCLDNIASYNAHLWTIQNGVLLITCWNGESGVPPYMLSSSTGLLGIPKRITIEIENQAESSDEEYSETEEENNKVDGYEIDYFLNGAIGVNDVVNIQSKKVRGLFRIHNLKMVGDNYSGDWKCTAQVVVPTFY